MKYKVTRSSVDTIVVEGRNAADALEKALDYESQWSWVEQGASFLVEEDV